MTHKTFRALPILSENLQFFAENLRAESLDEIDATFNVVVDPEIQCPTEGALSSIVVRYDWKPQTRIGRPS